ncbi:WYL domain-containing protein [Heliophilum fasciatum]|uniref:WYL domain-containing protein n=1 Tax=Heliophilum fasciatum TaxID=35700 RepID=A0A4R2RG37_9FIRM|nr:putative DNA-binding transcriptional regulator YafY [Heliophilum fasciatum]TCP62632.1 WYL domain-containing protein [Heliophilum fasciatum]
MESVSIKIKKTIENTIEKTEFNVSEYVRKTFLMYSGEPEYIEIQFDNSLINVILDKFGQDIDIEKVDGNSFKIVFEAAVSDGLFRWVLSWGSDAKVLSPNSLIERIKTESHKVANLY